MKQIMSNFVPGPHVGLFVEVEGDESVFLNEIINTIIDSSTYDIDEEALEEEAARAEKQLRERLVENRKSVGAFCYVNGITEDQLFAYCKANLVRTALENATILSIAEIEGIKVTEKDLAAYKQNYREQYARVLLTEPDFGEEELVEAICARKVLNFLKDNNTAQRKGDW